jgi:hypothetical protein
VAVDEELEIRERGDVANGVHGQSRYSYRGIASPHKRKPLRVPHVRHKSYLIAGTFTKQAFACYWGGCLDDRGRASWIEACKQA